MKPLLQKDDKIDSWTIDKFINGHRDYEYYSVSKLLDGKNSISAELALFCLPNNKWESRFILDKIFDLVNVFCQNHSFIPELVDYNDEIILKNRKIVTIILYSKFNFQQIPNRLENFQLPLLIKKLAYNILALHRQNIVIQELVLSNIDAFDAFIKTPFSFTKMNSYYDKNRAVLLPKKVFVAPECFDSSNKITVQSDVYALGKFALQLVLGQKEYNKIFNRNPFPEKKDYEAIVNKLKTSNLIKEFILKSIPLNQFQRFNDIFEAINYLKPNQSNPNKSVYSEKIRNMEYLEFFGGIIKNKIIDFYKLNSFSREKFYNFNNKTKILPDFFENNDKFKNTIAFSKKKNYKIIYQNKLNTISLKGECFILTDGDNQMIQKIIYDLPNIKKLYYVSTKNDFKDENKVEFYDIYQFLKNKRYRG